MTTSHYNYTIAGCHIHLKGPWADLVTLGLKSFSPFADDGQATPNITIITGCVLDNVAGDGLLTSFDFEDSRAVCRFFSHKDGWLLTIDDGQSAPLKLLYRNDNDTVETNAGVVTETCHIHYFRFGLWFVCNIAMAKSGITAIHSSAIIHNGEVVLFLGESGTGKSTHTRLWREHIKDATLLNDDSPMLALHNDRLYAYGSPWSGKTPCYKNESYPVRALVRLSQAPHNAMRRLSSLQAMGALLPSLSPAFMFDRYLENKVMEIASTILSHAPFYHLECLPNSDAAQLSRNTIFEK